MQIWVITLLCTLQIFLPGWYDEWIEVSMVILLMGWVALFWDIMFNSGK